MSESLSKVEAFLAALQEQDFFGDGNTEGSVLWYIAFYRKRAPTRRMAFRSSGFVLLFLSISLPFLTGIAPEHTRTAIASTLAWLIAVVAAANSFFGWQKGWQLFTQTQLALQFALSEWELRVAEARSAATDDDGMKVLQEALQKLTKTVTEAVSNETAQYFEGVKTPDVQSPKPVT
jgi:hypothetical protein